MIDEIVQKITEEKNNIIAQAFTMQIGSLLMSNGIVPIMTECTKNDMEIITDSDKYKMVVEFGVLFNELDTTEHDKQIRVEAIEEVKELIRIKLVDNLCLTDAKKYGNENAKQQSNSYSTVMKYEIADCVDDLLDDLEKLKGGAE